MTTRYPFYLAGEAIESDRQLVVYDKYSGAATASVSMADGAAIDAAISAAASAAPLVRRLPGHKRQSILQHVVQRLRAQSEEFAQTMVMEAGKPIRDARGEVARAIDTFRIAAEESVRIQGEHLALDISPRGEGYEGFVKRVPIGPCGFITPFNFPLNLVAHKVAGAIAMGCPFVLKPAPQAPISALRLAKVLAETELPHGAFSVVPCEIQAAAALVEDDRIKLLSFTGSAAVGWELKARAGKKKVVLELGGNAPCIVEPDADMEWAVSRIIFGAFYQSGQSCISVQRLFVHESRYEFLKARLIEEAAKLKTGHPRDESTFLGPLISEKDVQRIHAWVHEAVRMGAQILCGGQPTEPDERRFYAPTIVENVARDSKLASEEVFGPVMTIEPYATFEEACAKANASRYGLQAGVFTNNLERAFFAWNELEVGGVIINDVPSMRIDSMPYGGVKDSGLGREGVRYAMQEMSELRLMVTRSR